jgi:DNA topoisomerase-3
VREPPPLPFDLATLQQVCSQRLGLGVQETLRIAQALYETHKATTYPRTDCGYLPESMLAEVQQVLAALLVSDPTLEPLVNSLDRTQRSRAWNDREVTAHHGVIPTLEPARLADMSDKERVVYRLIRARYLAQFLPDYEFDRTIAQLACAGVSLKARGQQITTQGWRVALAGERATVEHDESAALSQSLPSLTPGMRCRVESIDLKALKTAAPSPYTQGELLGDMKRIARFVTDPRFVPCRGRSR